MQKYFAYMKEVDVNYPQWYELACWPDDLRTASLRLFDGWHFYDQPFYDGIEPKDANVTLDPKYNAANTVVICVALNKYRLVRLRCSRSLTKDKCTTRR